MRFQLRKILGISSDYILEHIILNTISVVVILLCFISVPINYITGMPILTVYGSFFIAISYIFLFLYSIKSKNFNRFYHLFFGFTIIIFLPFFWIINAGSFGPIPFFAILIFVWIIITSKYNSYLYFSILTIIVITVLLVIEYEFPQIVIGYLNKEARLPDIILGFFLIVASIVISLRIFMNIYRNALNKEIEQRLELHEKNEEIQCQSNELTKLNLDKDRFISILAHDLRGPFNGFLGLSELLAANSSRFDAGKIESIANSINQSAQNTYSLLEDLLLWAQSGNLPHAPQKINLSSVCTGIIETVNQIAKEKNISIYNFDSDELTIFADINMLKTILRNLISNAIKFTRPGGKINIFADQNQSNTTITVSDNGVGIDTETLKKLFNITHKKTIKGTANEKGNGLGLLICKEFVEKHGGKIWVESDYGKGSDFRFTLPLLQSSLKTHF